MRDFGLSLIIYAVLNSALTALLVFFRHDGADMELWTRGTFAIQMVCYALIFVGLLLVKRADARPPKT